MCVYWEIFFLIIILSFSFILLYPFCTSDAWSLIYCMPCISALDNCVLYKCILLLYRSCMDLLFHGKRKGWREIPCHPSGLKDFRICFLCVCVALIRWLTRVENTQNSLVKGRTSVSTLVMNVWRPHTMHHFVDRFTSMAKLQQQQNSWN